MGSPKRTTESNTAVIYARYSTHNQKDASIEQQVNECTKYANDNGYSISQVYADRAITGKTDRRASFQRMMHDAGDGRFHYVIAWKSNRMGRNMLEALLNEARLQDYGIRVLYTEEDFDDSAAGRFALRSMMNVNQFYSENLAEDIMRGMRDNAMNCKVNSGGLPLGYRKGPDGKYEIAPEEADVVREIYEKVNAGTLYVEIANELNSRGIKTKYGGLWNKNSFRTMLSNERYTGVYLWGDIRVEGGIPPIIGKELFYAVQEKINAKSTRGRHEKDGEYILTGKLFCGKCESLMTGMTGTGTSGAKYHYYACRKRNDPQCDKRYVQRDLLESAVAHAVMDYVFDPRMVDWMVNCCMEYQRNTFENQQLLSNKSRVEEINAELKNIVDAIGKGIYSETTRDRLLELEAERDHLKQEIEEQTCNLKPFTEEMYRYYLDSFKSGDVDNPAFRKKLIRQFVDSIYLFDDEFRITYSANGKAVNVPFETVKNAEELADSMFDLAPVKATRKMQVRMDLHFSLKSTLRVGEISYADEILPDEIAAAKGGFLFIVRRSTRFHPAPRADFITSQAGFHQSCRLQLRRYAATVFGFVLMDSERGGGARSAERKQAANPERTRLSPPPQRLQVPHDIDMNLKFM